MGEKTGIEWTDATWNPITGCTKISPGCAHCYAERITERFRGPGSFKKIVLHHERLGNPLHWRNPRRVFVNSMSDLFHEDVPDEFIAHVFAVMAQCPEHTFQILTKRPERMLAWFGWSEGDIDVEDLIGGALHDYYGITASGDPACGDGFFYFDWPLPNVWIGVSVENQHFANERIPLLLQTPAAVRFISYEPALSNVDFSEFLCYSPYHEYDQECGRVDLRSGSAWRDGNRFNGPDLENRQTRMGPLETYYQNQSLPTDESGEGTSERLSYGAGDDRQEADERIGSQIGMETLQRTAAERNDNQSQKWREIRQQTIQPRTYDTLGEHTACSSDSKSWESGASMGTQESCGETDNRTSYGNQGTQSQRRKVTSIGGGVRSRVSDHLACRAWRSKKLWLICGGESGAGARQMNPDWARSVRDQCVAAGVAFFFKQFSGLHPKQLGRQLDGRQWNEFPILNATVV